MHDWTDRAARHLRLEHGIDAEKMEYYLWVIRSPVKLRSLSDELADVIRYYNEKGIVPNIMAHSNGNVIVCRMLRKHPDIRIATLFMVAPACWSSCERNGLNVALSGAEPPCQRVMCFHSDNDKVVKWGGMTSFLKFAGLGYGRAGYTGLLDISATAAHRISHQDMTPWGHSTFGGEAPLPKFLDHLVIPRAVWIK